MDVYTWFDNYEGAEHWADKYKGDTGTDERVSVVEDFDDGRFLVVVGKVAEDERYEVQYEA